MSPTSPNGVVFPSEHSPLLGSDRESQGNGIITINSKDSIQDNEAQVDTNVGAPILEEEKSTLVLVGIMSSIWLGNFLAALDSTMVATLTAPISSSFNSLTLISWLATAYFVANAALQPLGGKLTDIYGRRAGLVFSNIVFCIGNLICGLAESEWQIVVGRVVAGMGGGGLTSITTFIASDLVPLRKRGIWQGIGNIMFGLGSASGGVFGGWINDWLGWRWAFLIQVPVSALSSVIVYFTVNIPVARPDESAWTKLRRIDFLGASVLVMFLILLLLGLNSGGNTVEWSHPLVLVSLPLSMVLLAVFIYIEANIAPEPVIPVRILTRRTIVAAFFTNWFHSMALFAGLFYGAIYFQLRGASPTEAGLRIMPQSLGVMLGSILAGFVIRSLGHYWRLNLLLQIVSVAGFAVLITCDLTTPRWPEVLSFFAVGVGYSAMLTITLIALIAAIDHKWQAVATSGSYAFRSTGSVIGITVASAVFQNALKAQLWERLAGEPGAEDIIHRVRDSFDAIRDLSPEWEVPVKEAYMVALQAVFGTNLGLIILGALVSLFMREHKLYSTLARRDST